MKQSDACDRKQGLCLLCAAWLFGVSGFVIVLCGLLVLFMDFSRDALAAPSGYRSLETNADADADADGADTFESGVASAASASSASVSSRSPQALI